MNHPRRKRWTVVSWTDRVLTLFLASLLMCGATVFAQTTPELGIREHTPDARAFVNATIVVSPDKTIEKGTLLIEHGRIVAVGQGVKLPDGIVTVDLEDYTIYPGLIDAYTDYGLPSVEKKKRDRNRRPDYYGDRAGGNAWNDAIHAEQVWSSQFRPNKKDALELKKLGFTTVQSIRKDGIFRGRSFVAQLGQGLPGDLILVPRGKHVISMDKGSSTQDYPESLMGSIAIIRQAIYDADWYQKAQAAYQVNQAQPRPEYNAALEALARIKNETVIIDGGNRSLAMYRIDRLKDEFGLAVIGLAAGHEYEWIEDIARMDFPVILPLDFPKKPDIATLEDDLDLTLARLRHWEMAPGNPASLATAGVRFSLTTHGLKKKSEFKKNLREALKRGLSEADALAALTVIPAELCGITSDAGTLEQGKLANFFITSGNYFDKETIVYSVWVGGDKTHLEDRPVVKFRGAYTLTLPSGEFELVLRLKKDKPGQYKGVIKAGEFSQKLKNISVDRNRITFSVKLDSLKSSGLARFSGRKSDTSFGGECELDNGERVNWSAVYTGEPTEPIDSTEAEELEEEKDEEDKEFVQVSRLTHPNMAYGYETIPQPQDVLIKNATVWSSDDSGILKQTDVLVRNGKFAKIGQGLTAPSSTLVIEAEGKHLTPGIVDAHSHIAGDGNINEGTHAVTSEVRITDIINPNSIHIYRQLAGGVTTIMLLHGSANPIGGQTEVLKLRWGSNPEEMKFEGAPLLIKFALGENVKQSNWGERFSIRYPQSRMGVEAIIADAFRAAQAYEKDWTRYHGLSKKEKSRTVPPRKDIQLDALVEILHDRMMVHCHSYMASETLMLIRLAEQFGFTLDVFVHMLEGYKVADEMAAHGAGATTFSDWWAYKFEVYDAIPYNAGLMHDRKVLTSINSDNADLARRLNQEAGKSVMYNGLDQADALKLVTINAAIQLGVGDQTGSITVGKDADFVIWSGNPLSMYSRAEQTWIDGARYYDIERNIELIASVEKEKNALIQKALKDSSGKSSGKWDDKPGEHRPDGERSEQ